VKILIADDHAIMRDGLRAILAREPDLEVVGQAVDGREAVEKALSLAPDIVLMDITMPGLNGLEATRRIRDARASVRVIGLSMHADPSYVRAMFAAGADAYLLKNSASEELLLAVRAVAERRSYVSPGVAERMGDGAGEAQARGGRSPGELSARQREVLQLLAEGKTSKEVAVQMDIAVSTVETYRRQIMERLDLHTVAELTKFAVRHGLTSIE
jgi:DNA-binding NarL/FixJ family response regulator